MTDPLTCGERFQACITDLSNLPLYSLLRAIAPAPRDSQAYLMAGSIVGQAEKCFLGACRLCIFRPAPAWDLFMQDVLEVICDHYEGLAYFYQPVRGEYWLYRLEWGEYVERAATLPYPSDMAHVHRARLCGIPEEEIDTDYHLRPGHDQPCEPTIEEAP